MKYSRRELPQVVDNPQCWEFMASDLARSGLGVTDLVVYPCAPVNGVAAYVIQYPQSGMYRKRINRADAKYISPKGRNEIWYSKDPHADLTAPLYIIEGEKKACKFQKQWPDLRVVAVGGAWNGLERTGAGHKLLPELSELVQDETRVVVILDGDITKKTNIQQAGFAYISALKALGCTMTSLVIPPSPFKGVDDYLVASDAPSLKDFVPFTLDLAEIGTLAHYKALGCVFTKNDPPKLFHNEVNASIILQNHFDGALYKDARLGLMLNNQQVSEDELTRQAIWHLQMSMGAYPRAKIEGGLFLLTSSPQDRVRDVVLSTEWDGVDRLDTWGSEFLTPKSGWEAHANEWGRLLITGMCLRILEPGTKVDHVPLLLGAQGIGKSTFFEELAEIDGHRYYYAHDGEKANDRGQTLGQNLGKSLIVDLAEGIVFDSRKTSQDSLKQWVTSCVDTYRIAFAKAPSEVPRGFVFVGTSNRRDLFSDSTGSRRWLPLEVSKIKRLDYRTKLQLLAEVVAKEDTLRNSPWYELRLNLEDAPEELRAAHGHITNVQELINTQYGRPEQAAAYIEQLISAGASDLAVIKTGAHAGELFLSAPFLEAKAPSGTFRGLSAARTLSGLLDSPNLSYALAPYKPLATSLTFPQNSEHLYLENIANKQRMLTGYRIKPRAQSINQS